MREQQTASYIASRRTPVNYLLVQTGHKTKRRPP
jgi:hypothetical protein